jgi:F-type H+-transporting ATPase subunit gamma
LSSVIGAMRGIAAARARESRGRAKGVRAYAETVGAAIGQALTLAGGEGASSGGKGDADGQLVIALGAEQGFAGAFNRRVLEVASQVLRPHGPQRGELIVLGARGMMAAGESGLDIGWSAPMIAHVDEVGTLADRITQQLYDRLDSGRATRVTLVYATPGQGEELNVVKSTLLPFDFARFPRERKSAPPLITLPPETLLMQLAEEYVFAELCEALTLSLAAENEARTRAMTAAKSNVEKKLNDLVARSRQLRQEEITSEIIELSRRLKH